MSVIDVRLIGEKRKGGKTSMLVATYTKVWRVQTNNTLDGPSVVLAAPGIATEAVTTYASGSDSDPNAICTSVTAEEEGDSFKSWIVTEEYSTVPLNQTQLNQNPLLDPVRYFGNFDQFQRIARFDVDGKVLRNSRKEPYRDPPITVPDSVNVLVAVRNEAFINWSLVGDMKDSVNSSAWKMWGPRCWKVKMINPGEVQVRNNVEFYTVRYEIALNPDTWDEKVLNLARTYLDAPNGKKVTLDDSKDSVVVDKTNDTKADAITPVENQYNVHRVLKERDFSVFNL